MGLEGSVTSPSWTSCSIFTMPYAALFSVLGEMNPTERFTNQALAWYSVDNARPGVQGFAMLDEAVGRMRERCPTSLC